MPGWRPTSGPAAADVARSAAERLLAALRRNGPTRVPADERELRAATADFARALRATGLPPEAMVIATKRLLAEAANARYEEGTSARRERTERVVHWAIEAYFDDAAPRDDRGR